VSHASREPASSLPAPAAAAGRGATSPQDSVDVLRVVRARWRLFCNVCLGVVAVGVVVAFAWPAGYSTTAVVMLEPRKNNVTDQSSVLSDMPTDPASIQNQIQLLTSRDVAARVIEQLGLEHDPEFNAPPLVPNPLKWLKPAQPASPEQHFDAVVTGFLKHLTVEAIGLSTTITVTFTSRDPEKSARIADAVVDAYLNMEAAVRFDTTQRTTDWLLGRIRQLGLQAQAADAGIQRYKAEHDLNDTPNGGSLVDQQLVAINEQLVTARADLAAKEAESARIASLMHSGRVADVSQIMSSPLIIQLREQQADLIRQLAQLSNRYGPENPKLIAAQSQKRDLDAKIAEEVDRLAGSMQNEVAIARAQGRSLEESLQRGESEAAEQNMARVQLQSLESGAESTRSIFESFVSRLRETQGQDGLQIVDAREISHAPVPNAPTSPPRLLIVAASVPAGLLLALLAVLLAERFGGPVQTDLRREPARPAQPLRPAQAVRSAQPPGRVPLLAEVAGAQRAAELAVEQPGSACSQSLRALVQRIAVQRPRIVAVTSLDPREGQTSVAAGLARAASQLGIKVLLVDGRLAQPGMASRLGLSLPKAGIVEVLSGSAGLNQVLQRDPRSNALLLSGSARSVEPLAVWSSQTMAALMNHLRLFADLVIVDAVPLAPGNEFPLIARHADALIVVTASKGGPGLAAALQYLGSTTTKPAGIVLTR